METNLLIIDYATHIAILSGNCVDLAQRDRLALPVSRRLVQRIEQARERSIALLLRETVVQAVALKVPRAIGAPAAVTCRRERGWRAHRNWSAAGAWTEGPKGTSEDTEDGNED